VKTKIQLISAQPERWENGTLEISSMENPCTFDSYDVNVIDLTSQVIWSNLNSSWDTVGLVRDFRSLKQIAQNSQASVIVFALPPNNDFFCSYNNYAKDFDHVLPLKDLLPSLTAHILPEILPVDIGDALLFEPSVSLVNGRNFSASFVFLPQWTKRQKTTVLTQAEGSQKATTISQGRFYLTTLQITESAESLLAFLRGLDLLKDSSERYPDWLLAYDVFDDVEQKARIAQCRESIQKAETVIQKAETKQRENLRCKSILVETGDNLVEVVFSMLEKIFDCDLSAFVDEKKEDFRFTSGETTFIGEIKGISSNVKSEHISQVERHFQAYQDELQEEGRQETVKQLLIVNPFRSSPLAERDPVHQIQIDLARRNGCLIITTEILLKLFERFCAHELTSAEIRKVVSENVGLLTMDAFASMKGQLA